MRTSTVLAFSLLIASLTACDGGADREVADPAWQQETELFDISDGIVERGAPPNNPNRPAPNPDRNAYFGDLHVHTTLSMDAYVFGTTIGPRDAYRYALGEAIAHPAGFELKRKAPLDFYAITDHALFMGLARQAGDTTSDFSKQAPSKPLHNMNDNNSTGAFALIRRLGQFTGFVPGVIEGILDGSIDHDEVVTIKKSAWSETIEAADAFYNPGTFTTFVAYEYTPSAMGGGNLHRNVIFEGSQRLPAEPFSRFNSRNPERLWDWMDALRDDGIEALAIPHNSNGSNGQMFKLADWAGDPLDDAYAKQRIRNEPLIEMTQIKGTSETHPTLSDTDEWADFEIMPYIVGGSEVGEIKGSYVREALREGLTMEDAGTTNPFKVGFVAASDTHTGATMDDETNYHSKIGLLDATPALRGSTPTAWWQALLTRWLRPELGTTVDGRAYTFTPTTTFGASGLAGVWAEENTRESIYAAFRRKETFATSGPRLRVRFFASFGFDADLAESPSAIRRAYTNGVPMGGELSRSNDETPRFFAQAMRDPTSAPLQRLQIIKGWTANGESHEQVYDVACSGGDTPDPTSHRCPDNGARVDLSDCSYTEDRGSGELSTVWQDPDFDPIQRAFYYVRVLENPTCRWSTWDALREGLERRSDLHATLQERAWSSPIWYDPTSPSAAAVNDDDAE